MGRTRLKGTAIAGAAVLALGAGATVAIGASHPISGGGSQGANRYVVGAWLDAAQERPRPTGNLQNAEGKFEARLVRRGSMWVARNRGAKLGFEGLSGPAVAAHIHLGGVGTAGPIQKNICGTSGVPACRDGVRVPFAITNTQLTAIRQGKYYVNVHTAQNPAGEIRGQQGWVYRVMANANVGQERPRPRGTRRGAMGRLSGYLVKYGNRGHLDTKLTYGRLTGAATAAHIHSGRPGRAGRVLVDLCGTRGTPSCRSGVTGMEEVRGSLLRALLAGRTYANIHTRQNPGGEVRGQIRTPKAR